ncbi:MAG: DUF4332 domain-containing protein [Verrucomicrobiales bacterium]
MTKLHLIAGISPHLQRQLEEAGVASVESLAQQEAGLLVQRMIPKAKRNRDSKGVTLSQAEADRLIQLARALVGFGVPNGRGKAAAIASGDLSVDLDKVPEAIVVRPSAAASVPEPEPEPEPELERPAPAKPKFHDFKAYQEGRTGVAPLPRKPAEDEEEVEGSLKRFNYQPGEPVPRVVRRGVPHPRPFFLVFCSLIVLVSRLLLLTVIVGTPVVVWPAFAQGDTSPLIGFLWVIGAWMVSCLFFVVFAVRARCRVCTNHIFWSKRCTKNAKAHRVPGLGLTGSLALHALMFGWFRCMYCGTAIRMKFVSDPERSG